MALKSTCPCNFTLHYEVASRGNIILSGQQSANLTTSHRGKRATVTFDKNIHATQLPPTASGKMDPFTDSSKSLLHEGAVKTFMKSTSCLADSSHQAEMDSCVTYLQFPVSHSMAPLSRLLVYYVRDNGEGVTDSLQIPIQPSFENQVWPPPTLYTHNGKCIVTVTSVLPQHQLSIRLINTHLCFKPTVSRTLFVIN